MSRGLSKGAVVTHIPTQFCQGDENFAGIGDDVAMTPITKFPCRCHQRSDIRAISKRPRGSVTRSVFGVKVRIQSAVPLVSTFQ